MNNTSHHTFRPVRLFQVVLLVVSTFAAASRGDAAAPSDFTLRAPSDGQTFQLSAARGKFVALHFLLKTECPFCLKHTRDYARQAATTPGVVHVFIKPDSDEEIRSWARKAKEGTGLPPFPVYRDPDAALARAFDIPDGYRFHGQTVHYPALVLLDPAGKEVFRHVGKNNSDRFPYDRFAVRLDELKRQSQAGTGR